MVKGTTQFAVALLLLVAGAGLPALAAVDGPDGATGGATAAISSLNETDGTTNETLTNTTNTTNTTDDTTNSTETDDTTNATNETLTNTTDETNTTNTTDDTANTTNETLTNTTNTTEGATNETEDATNTTNTTDDTTNSTDGATNTTDSVTGATDEVTNTTDGMTDTVADVTNESAATPLSNTSLKFSSTTLTDTSLSSSSSLPDDPLDSDGSDSSRSSDSSGSTAQSSTERKDEAVTETTATTSSASTEDRTGGRDGIVPEGASEAMVGMGALTAAALVPQLADALALVGNAGGLLSASTAFAGSTSGGRSRRVGGLRNRIDRLWRFVTPFRYSRWDDSDPLDHEIREALYETVERAPGAYLSEVCDHADVALSTARHHLDVLEDEGLVTTAKVRGKRRYYPDHAPDVELTAALEDEGTAEVLHALARLGASHGGRLADELDRDASTVSHHLSRLEDAGLVEREREGRAVFNRLAPEVQAVLRGDGETDGDTDAETPAVAD